VSRLVAVLVAAGAGCLVGMQAPINSRLGRSVGTYQAATFSFLVGLIALVLMSTLVAKGGVGELRHVTRVPWWALLGGLCGAVYVAVAIVAVRSLGVSGLTGAVIAGQLAVSVVIDRLGLLGVPRQPVSALRIAGIVLLVAGVFLVVRR
jgi:transporter family-2 protein